MCEYLDDTTWDAGAQWPTISSDGDDVTGRNLEMGAGRRRVSTPPRTRPDRVEIEVVARLAVATRNDRWPLPLAEIATPDFLSGDDQSDYPPLEDSTGDDEGSMGQDELLSDTAIDLVNIYSDDDIDDIPVSDDSSDSDDDRPEHAPSTLPVGLHGDPTFKRRAADSQTSDEEEPQAAMPMQTPRHRIPPPDPNTHNGVVSDEHEPPVGDEAGDESDEETMREATIGGMAGDRYGRMLVMAQRVNARAIRFNALTKGRSEIAIADMNRECVHFLQQADARGYAILCKHQVDELNLATNSRTTRIVMNRAYRATEAQWRILEEQWVAYILASDVRMPSRLQLRKLDVIVSSPLARILLGACGPPQGRDLRFINRQLHVYEANLFDVRRVRRSRAFMLRSGQCQMREHHFNTRMEALVETSRLGTLQAFLARGASPPPAPEHAPFQPRDNIAFSERQTIANYLRIIIWRSSAAIRTTPAGG
jgi:hypothetical protein